MNTNRTILCASLWLVASLVATPGQVSGRGWGGVWGAGCGPCCTACVPCPPTTCKVLVPQMVTEHETKTIVSYRPETRQRMVTVYRDVPTTKTIEEEYTVWVPQTRMQTVVDTINHPVYGDIELRKTTMTPRVEARQATLTVTRLAPFQEVRTQWAIDDSCPTCAASGLPAPPPSRATLPDKSPAGNMDANAPPAPRGALSVPDPIESGGACDTCSVSVPRKVCVTCWRPVSHQEKVEYPLTNFQPNSRMETVSFYEYKPETKTREVPYVVQVPETRTRTREISVMRTVAEQQPEKYTVMVPYQERIDVPVLRCRYVEQTVIDR
jgi:hypothetical protein